jgi:hypothetical protein
MSGAEPLCQLSLVRRIWLVWRKQLANIAGPAVVSSRRTWLQRPARQGLDAIASVRSNLSPNGVTSRQGPRRLRFANRPVMLVDRQRFHRWLVGEPGSHYVMAAPGAHELVMTSRDGAGVVSVGRGGREELARLADAESRGRWRFSEDPSAHRWPPAPASWRWVVSSAAGGPGHLAFDTSTEREAAFSSARATEELWFGWTPAVAYGQPQKRCFAAARRQMWGRLRPRPSVSTSTAYGSSTLRAARVRTSACDKCRCLAATTRSSFGRKAAPDGV